MTRIYEDHPQAYPLLDERDRVILEKRQRAFTETAVHGPQAGEVVIFADGVKRRISHVWPGYTDDEGRIHQTQVQTSDGGSFYVGEGYCSFSGSLYTPVPADTLTDTGEVETIPAWFFHHDWHTAHNGITVPLDVRVWQCSRESKDTR